MHNSKKVGFKKVGLGEYRKVDSSAYTIQFHNVIETRKGVWKRMSQIVRLLNRTLDTYTVRNIVNEIEEMSFDMKKEHGNKRYIELNIRGFQDGIEIYDNVVEIALKMETVKMMKLYKIGQLFPTTKPFEIMVKEIQNSSIEKINDKNIFHTQEIEGSSKEDRGKLKQKNNILSAKTSSQEQFTSVTQPIDSSYQQQSKIVNQHNQNEVNASDKGILNLGELIPTKSKRIVETTERNQTLSQKLKNLYKNRCQICGQTVQIGVNEYSSESHHIQPVGGKHHGPDVAANIIILCPNHHLMFDRGAITIDLDNKRVIHVDETNSVHYTKLVTKHEIEERYVNYHNKLIFKGLGTSPQSDQMDVKQLANYEKLIIVQGSEGEEYEFSLPNQYNKYHMKEIEKLLLYAKEGDTLSYNDFSYVVKVIKKLE